MRPIVGVVKHKVMLPTCYAFLDNHKSKAVSNGFSRSSSGNYIVTHNHIVGLHHHAIIAVHPDHVERMRDLEGENTLNANRFTDKGIQFGRKKSLSDKQADELRAKRDSGLMIKDLMTEYSLSKASVYRILNNKELVD